MNNIACSKPLRLVYLTLEDNSFSVQLDTEGLSLAC